MTPSYFKNKLLKGRTTFKCIQTDSKAFRSFEKLEKHVQTVQDNSNMVYGQTLILVDLIVVNLISGFSTLLETVPFVFDHIWTLDSPIVPLTVDGKTRPYIDQGGSKLEV